MVRKSGGDYIRRVGWGPFRVPGELKRTDDLNTKFDDLFDEIEAAEREEEATRRANPPGRESRSLRESFHDSDRRSALDDAVPAIFGLSGTPKLRTYAGLISDNLTVGSGTPAEAAELAEELRRIEPDIEDGRATVFANWFLRVMRFAERRAGTAPADGLRASLHEVLLDAVSAAESSATADGPGGDGGSSGGAVVPDVPPRPGGGRAEPRSGPAQRSSTRAVGAEHLSATIDAVVEMLAGARPLRREADRLMSRYVAGVADTDDVHRYRMVRLRLLMMESANRSAAASRMGPSARDVLAAREQAKFGTLLGRDVSQPRTP